MRVKSLGRRGVEIDFSGQSESAILLLCADVGDLCRPAGDGRLIGVLSVDKPVTFAIDGAEDGRLAQKGRHVAFCGLRQEVGEPWRVVSGMRHKGRCEGVCALLDLWLTVADEPRHFKLRHGTGFCRSAKEGE